MRARWEALQPRERLMVIAGVTVLAVFLLYWLVWQPLGERQNELVSQVAAEREQLVWMRQASQQVTGLRGASAGQASARGDGRSLLAIVDSTAKAANIRAPINRMQPEGSDGVRLWIEKAPFDGLVQWLGVLERSHGITVTRADIQPADAPGRIDSRLSLKRP